MVYHMFIEKPFILNLHGTFYVLKILNLTCKDLQMTPEFLGVHFDGKINSENTLRWKGNR